MPTPQAQVAAAEAQIVEQSKRIEFYLTEYSVELLALKMKRYGSWALISIVVLGASPTGCCVVECGWPQAWTSIPSAV